MLEWFGIRRKRAQFTGSPATSQLPASAAELEKIAALRRTAHEEYIGVAAIPGIFRRSTSPRTADVIEMELQQCDQAIREAKRKHTRASSNCLPLETDLRTRLDEELKNVLNGSDAHSGGLLARRNALELEAVSSTFDRYFPRIDMSFLSKRKWSADHQCLLPLFSVFGLEDPVFKLECSIKRRGWGCPVNGANISPLLWQYFNFDPLRDAACTAFYSDSAEYFQGATATISARFTGAIPDPVRQLIHRWRQPFPGEVERAAQRMEKERIEPFLHFDAMYIVAEAPSWQISVRPTPPPPLPINGDPLVIGMKNELFWLIACFDTTPAEEYVRREFTIGDLQ